MKELIKHLFLNEQYENAINFIKTLEKRDIHSFSYKNLEGELIEKNRINAQLFFILAPYIEKGKEVTEKGNLVNRQNIVIDVYSEKKLTELAERYKCNLKLFKKEGDIRIHLAILYRTLKPKKPSPPNTTIEPPKEVFDVNSIDEAVSEDNSKEEIQKTSKQNKRGRPKKKEE